MSVALGFGLWIAGDKRPALISKHVAMRLLLGVSSFQQLCNPSWYSRRVKTFGRPSPTPESFQETDRRLLISGNEYKVRRMVKKAKDNGIRNSTSFQDSAKKYLLFDAKTKRVNCLNGLHGWNSSQCLNFQASSNVWAVVVERLWFGATLLRLV